MGGKLVKDSLLPKQQDSNNLTTPPKSYTELFNECFPHYLLMGMTEEQFWDKDCELVVYYRKADTLRTERKNEEMWLQGAYFYEALCSVSPILHAFAKQGTKVLPYRKEPFAINERQEKLQEEKRQKQAYDKGKDLIGKLMKNMNEKQERK